MNRLLLFGLFLGVSCLLQPATTLAQGSSLETRALREDYRRLQSQLADLLGGVDLARALHHLPQPACLSKSHLF